MGCDIHLFTERKMSINLEEKWVNIDNWKLNPYYEENNEDREVLYSINPAYSSRDYNLFSMLADVRNRSENKYISEPKGLPEDVSEVIKKVSESWGDDGHSHSFFTMGELYDFQKENSTQKYFGLVDSEGRDKINKGEMPEWWCQGSSSPLIKMEWTRENDTLNNFISTLESHFKSQYYDKSVDSEKFRIVFWFDN